MHTFLYITALVTYNSRCISRTGLCDVALKRPHFLLKKFLRQFSVCITQYCLNTNQSCDTSMKQIRHILQFFLDKVLNS